MFRDICKAVMTLGIVVALSFAILGFVDCLSPKKVPRATTFSEPDPLQEKLLRLDEKFERNRQQMERNTEIINEINKQVEENNRVLREIADLVEKTTEKLKDK